MTDSSDKEQFYVPGFIRSAFESLLLPGQKLEEVLDQMSGLILEGSNHIKPDETVWGSKTMTLNSKKPRTIDVFFKKVVKTETSDVESNCSVNSNSGSVLDESIILKKSPDSRAAISSGKESKQKLKPKKSKSRQHSISSSEDEYSERNGRNSPTYSVDLFAEETQESSNPKEINPPSQLQGYSSQNSSTKSNKQNISMDKEISSSSSSDEDSEQPVMSKLDSIKNSMKNIKEVFSEIESNSEKFSFGDLTEDDELYILQCPSEIDSKKLKGVKLTLEGSSVISVEDDVPCDCFAIKENPKRYLYVALPDSNEKGMKLGVFQLAGNIIVSENLGIPFKESIEDSLNDEAATTECFSKDVSDVLDQLAAKKKKRKHTSLESSDIDSKFSDIESVKTEYADALITPETEDQETPKKSKKKKKRSSEGKDLDSTFSEFKKVQNLKTDWEDSQIIPETQDEGTPLKSKKKKKHNVEGEHLDSSFSDNKVKIVKTDWEDSKIIPDTQDQHTPLKSKKKKKRSMEGNDLESSFSDNKVQIVKTDWEDSQIIPDTQDQETPLKVKKKKKRDKEETTQDQATESEFFSENVTDVLNKLASKKKKKKHSLGSYEATDYESEVDKSLNIKTEREELQGSSDFQETPSKAKKRSRKDIEDSEEFSKEEVPKKKKKKKYCYSESEDML